jgi:V/A-type H+/Na+-transporting ATPase subunit C
MRRYKMGSVIRFAAVNTKIRVMESKFLKQEQYMKLISCKDYLEAIKYLKEGTVYSEILSSYKIEGIHRGKLETILKRSYMNNFYKLRYYFHGDYKRLFNILFIRFEIEDLKIILRCKYVGRSDDEIRELICARGPLSNLNYDKLIACGNIQEVVESLSGTIYYESLLPLLNTVNDKGLFRLEMMLDFIYFNLLRDHSKEIKRSDREILHEIMGEYCDLLNIQWIIRGRKHYKFTSEELFNYTIYDGYRLNCEDLKALCYAKDENEFYTLIENTPYHVVFNRNNTSEYLSERNILVYLKNIFQKYKNFNNMDISELITYLELLLIELRDVISIVENKRYNVGFEETLKYITVEVQ